MNAGNSLTIRYSLESMPILASYTVVLLLEGNKNWQVSRIDYFSVSRLYITLLNAETEDLMLRNDSFLVPMSKHAHSLQCTGFAMFLWLCLPKKSLPRISFLPQEMCRKCVTELTFLFVDSFWVQKMLSLFPLSSSICIQPCCPSGEPHQGEHPLRSAGTI